MLIKEDVVKECDAVEVISDHRSSRMESPIHRATKGVIIDLSEETRVATVEFTLQNEIEVYSFHADDLRIIDGWQPRDVMSYLADFPRED